jgi:hypothetical protein
MLTPDHDQTKTNHIGSVYLMLFDDSELNFEAKALAVTITEVGIERCDSVLRFLVSTAEASPSAIHRPRNALTHLMADHSHC